MATVLHEFLVKLGFVTDAASAKRFDDSVKTATAGIKGVHVAMAAMAVGIEEAIRRTMRSFDQLYFTSKLTGIPAKLLADLQYGLKAIGVDAGRALSGIAEALREPATAGLITSLVGNVENAGDAFLKLSHEYAKAIKETGGEMSQRALSLKYTMSQIPGVDFESIRAAALNEEIMIKAIETRSRVAKRFNLDDKEASEQAQKAQSAWNEFTLTMTTGIAKVVSDNFVHIQRIFDALSKWMQNPTLVSALRAIVVAVKDIIVTTADLIWNELKGIDWRYVWIQLKDAARDFTVWVATTFRSIDWAGAWRTFKTAASAVWEWFLGEVRSVNWRGVWETFKSAAAAVFVWLGDTIRSIDWAGLWASFKSIASATFTWLWEQLSAGAGSIDWLALWNTIKSGFLAVIVWIEEQFAAIDWNKFGQALLDAYNNYTKWLGEQIKAIDWMEVGRWIGKTLSDAIIGMFTLTLNIAEWIEKLNWEEIGRNAGRMIGSAITLAIGAIFSSEGDGLGKSLQQKILDAMIGIAGAAIRIGAALVSGIAQGIYESIPGLKTAVDAIVDIMGLPGRLHDKLFGPDKPEPLPIPPLPGPRNAGDQPDRGAPAGGTPTATAPIPKLQAGGIVRADLHHGEMVLPAAISSGLQSMFMRSPGAGGGGSGIVGDILKDLKETLDASLTDLQDGVRSLHDVMQELLDEFTHWWGGDASFRPMIDLAAGVYDRLHEMLAVLLDETLKAMGYEGGLYGEGKKGEGAGGGAGAGGAGGGGGGGGGAGGGPEEPAGAGTQVAPPGSEGQFRPKYELKEADLSDAVVNTIAGEATRSQQSIDAVVNTMMNRLGTKGYGPSGNLQQVARAPGQFVGYKHADPELAKMIRDRITAIASGTVEDITKGANEFRTGSYTGPWAQKHPNAPIIGGNRFAYNPAGGVSPYAPYGPGGAPAGAPRGPGGPEEDRSKTPETTERVPGLPSAPGADVKSLQPDFQEKVKALLAAAKAATGESTIVTSGFRSYAHQMRLWLASDRSGKMVAAPGSSMHNRGMAVDISRGGRAALKYIHDHAKEFGLHFPMNYEEWHLEPLGAKRGKPGRVAETAQRAEQQYAAMQATPPLGAGGDKRVAHEFSNQVTINVNEARHPREVAQKVAQNVDGDFNRRMRNFQTIAT